MTKTKRTMVSVAAGGLWCLVGLLSGAVLGLSAGRPPRLVVFLAALGLAIGWFGFSGTYRRINGKAKLNVVPTEPLKPISDEGKLSGEKARAWLDDFLVKQQQK